MAERLDLSSIFDAAQYASPDRTFDLEVRGIGTLRSRGALVACDPFGDVRPPFAQLTPTGEFQVEVLLARDQGSTVVALSRVVFRAERPVRFTMATCPGEDPRALAPGQSFGYGVDSWTGCFSTPEAARTVDGNALVAALQANRDSQWSAATTPAIDGVAEFVAFSSGDGDGVYASWFGVDDYGAPVCLVTDFRVLDLELPAVVDDPAFRREHAERAAERLFALLPELEPVTRDLESQAEALRWTAELTGSPPDAAHLTLNVFDRYVTATGDARHALGKVVKRLLEAPEAQRRLAPRFAAMDPDHWTALLQGVREELSDGLLDVLWARWNDAPPELRKATLHLATRARLTLDQKRRFQAAATEALRATDAAVIEEALVILQLLASVALPSSPDAETRAEVLRLATEGSTERTRRLATKLSARLGSPASET